MVVSVLRSLCSEMVGFGALDAIGAVAKGIILCSAGRKVNID